MAKLVELLEMNRTKIQEMLQKWENRYKIITICHNPTGKYAPQAQLEKTIREITPEEDFWEPQTADSSDFFFDIQSDWEDQDVLYYDGQ